MSSGAFDDIIADKKPKGSGAFDDIINEKPSLGSAAVSGASTSAKAATGPQVTARNLKTRQTKSVGSIPNPSPARNAANQAASIVGGVFGGSTPNSGDYVKAPVPASSPMDRANRISTDLSARGQVLGANQTNVNPTSLADQFRLAAGGAVQGPTFAGMALPNITAQQAQNAGNQIHRSIADFIAPFTNGIGDALSYMNPITAPLSIYQKFQTPNQPTMAGNFFTNAFAGGLALPANALLDAAVLTSGNPQVGWRDRLGAGLNLGLDAGVLDPIHVAGGALKLGKTLRYGKNAMMAEQAIKDAMASRPGGWFGEKPAVMGEMGGNVAPTLRQTEPIQMKPNKPFQPSNGSMPKEPWQMTSVEWAKSRSPRRDYQMSHRAPTSLDGMSKPLWDVTGVYPDDVYTPQGLKFYDAGMGTIEKTAWDILQKAKGNPNYEVTIYRAVPKDVAKTDGVAIKPGDWVSTTKEYARQHGVSNIDGPFTIVSKKVKAKDIYTNGDSWHEWGYDPSPELSHKRFVENALSSGKDVPVNVLAEYPDLIRKYKDVQSRPIPTPEVIPTPKPTEPVTPTTEPLATPKVEPVKPTGSPESPRISANVAAMDEEMARRGLDPTKRPPRETIQGWVETAQEQGIPDRAVSIAQEVNKKPRQMTNIETAGMTEAMQKNTDARVKLEKLLDGADEATVKSIGAQIDQLDQEWNTMAEAVRKSGTEWGRAGVAKQLELRDDMSFEGLRRKFTKAAGRPPTSEELITLREHADKIAGLQKELDDLRAASQKETLGEDIKTGRSGGAKRNAAAAKEARLQAAEEFKQAIAKAQSAAHSNPIEPLSDIAKAAGKYMYHLSREVAWNSVDHLLTVTKAQLKELGFEPSDSDLLRGYDEYRTSQGKTRTALQIERGRLKAELNKAAREASGRPRQYKEGTSVKTKQAAAVERLQKRLDEVNKALEEGRYQDALPKKKTERYKSQEEIRKKRQVDQAVMQAKAHIMMNTKKKGLERFDTFLSSAALLNPAPRIWDVAANTAKLTSEVASAPLDWAITRITDKVLGGKGKGLTELSFAKVRRMLDGYGTAVKNDWKVGMMGGSVDDLAKYGKSGLGGRIAGLTDAPFKELYTRSMLDDFALQQARLDLGKGASKDAIATRQAYYMANPTDEMAVAAHEYALRQTFNNDNAVSKVLSAGVNRLKNGNSKGEKAAGVFLGQVLRFNKVITNVALDRAANLPMGGPTMGFVKAAESLATYGRGRIPAQDIRAIAQYLRRGLTGTGLTALGAVMVRNNLMKPDIKKTENGSLFVDWGPLDQIGGAFSGVLYGASMEAIDRAPLTEKQKETLRKKYTVDYFTSTPIASDVRTVGRALDTPSTAEKALGQYAGRIFVPSIIRHGAEAMDMKDGENGVARMILGVGEPRDVKATTMVQQLMKYFPILRNQLPTATRRTIN